MKRWIKYGLLYGILLVLFICIPTLKSDAIVVQKIFGMSLNCDTALVGCQPFLSTITTLCTVSCASRVAPSFTSNTRFYGNGVGPCSTSVDGGATWAGCTTQPGVDGNTYQYFVEASDGSVIATGNNGANNICLVRRSTDSGTSWSTVFTSGSPENCAVGNEGQRLYCLLDSRCEWLVSDGTTFRVFRSSNNGLNWTEGTTDIAPNCGNASSAWNGSVGIFPSIQSGCGGGNIAKTESAAADTWSASVVWNGTQGNCWGSLIYNGNARVICHDGTTGYKMYSSAGALSASLTLPEAIQVLDGGGVSHSTGTNTMYIAAQLPTTIGLWISRDNLGTFIQLGTLAGGGAGIRGGNTFLANGCLYFSYGFGAAALAKVC